MSAVNLLQGRLQGLLLYLKDYGLRVKGLRLAGLGFRGLGFRNFPDGSNRHTRIGRLKFFRRQGSYRGIW